MLWQLVQEKYPNDVEAAHKAKDLAASETIQRGQYVETAAGSRESPALARMEDAAKLKQDKLAREAEPVQKRIEADPTEPTLYVQLAGLYRRNGQDDRARNVLQQALGPTGNDYRVQSELMDLDLGPVRKNLEAAEQKLRRLKEKAKAGADEDDAAGDLSAEELAQLRARLVKEVNTREIELFRLKADRFPNEVAHRLELGIRLLKADLVDEAIAELQQARKDEKGKWKAAMYLGFAFKKRNKARAGAAELRGGDGGPAAGRGGGQEGDPVPARQRRRRDRRAAAGRRPRPRAGQPRLRLQGHRQAARRLARTPDERVRRKQVNHRVTEGTERKDKCD